MGRELQKKKRRSKRQPVRPKKTSKVVNPRGNGIVAQNWDKKETLAQNYRRLGLVARLKTPAGGTEKMLAAFPAGHDAFAIAAVDKAIVSEVRVERGADGRIVGLLGREHENPLNDPLAALDDDDGDDENGGAGEGESEWTGVPDVDAAAAQASLVVQSLVQQSRNSAPKRPRHLSEGERQWLEMLVAKHGHDTAAMARDRKRNPMQQTAADIASRLNRMHKSA